MANNRASRILLETSKQLNNNAALMADLGQKQKQNKIATQAAAGNTFFKFIDRGMKFKSSGARKTYFEKFGERIMKVGEQVPGAAGIDLSVFASPLGEEAYENFMEAYGVGEKDDIYNSMAPFFPADPDGTNLKAFSEAIVEVQKMDQQQSFQGTDPAGNELSGPGGVAAMKDYASTPGFEANAAFDPDANEGMGAMITSIINSGGGNMTEAQAVQKLIMGIANNKNMIEPKRIPGMVEAGLNQLRKYGAITGPSANKSDKPTQTYETLPAQLNKTISPETRKAHKGGMETYRAMQSLKRIIDKNGDKIQIGAVQGRMWNMISKYFGQQNQTRSEFVAESTNAIVQRVKTNSGVAFRKEEMDMVKDMMGDTTQNVETFKGKLNAFTTIIGRGLIGNTSSGLGDNVDTSNYLVDLENVIETIPATPEVAQNIIDLFSIMKRHNMQNDPMLEKIRKKINARPDLVRFFKVRRKQGRK